MTRALPAALALALLPGCFAGRYVAQAAGGQLGILRAARPIDDAAADPRVEPRVRRLLLAVPQVKAFGASHGLHATGSYVRYADLHRRAAVWVVQACAPLSFDVRHWTFPVVGSMPYLGWFDASAARRHADALAKEGLDVDVRAASAFSTLGWFRDPVLSTMIPEGELALGELVNVVLHESVHATLYVSGQSAFDESLASFVADRLTPAFLERALGARAPEARAWIEAEARGRARTARLHRAYEELDALYRSARGDDDKRAEKARIVESVRAELGLSRAPNNATLAGYRTYETGTAGFERLLAACGGSFPRFLRALATLRESDFAAPQQRELDPVLERLAAGGCPSAPDPHR